MSFLVENCQIICFFFYVGGHSMLIWQEKPDTYRFIIYRLIVRTALPNLYDGVAFLHCLKFFFRELMNYTGHAHCAVFWICFVVTPHIVQFDPSWWQMPHPTSFQSAFFSFVALLLLACINNGTELLRTECIIIPKKKGLNVSLVHCSSSQMLASMQFDLVMQD